MNIKVPSIITNRGKSAPYQFVEHGKSLAYGYIYVQDPEG
jgi:hypothetical protein